MQHAHQEHLQDESPATMEDLLLEMRRVQELQLKRIKRLEALFDTLAERIEVNRGHTPALVLRGMRHPLRRRGDLGKARG